MILQKAYGPGAITAAAAILMALSMVINESLVARTFGTYALRPFDISGDSLLVPVLGVGLIVFAYVVNISGNRSVGIFSLVMAVLKVGGVALFGIAALWAGGFSFSAAADHGQADPIFGFIASVALSILAFKGFTTITNSGAEIADPHHNVGRAIIASILICVVIYLLVAFAVGSNLSISEIIAAKDYSLAQAAEPALGRSGFHLTVALALIATASGLLASVFAVSRMLAMLTEMELVPHSHFGMSGPIREHTLVYTVVIAAVLTVFFNLSRIASLGVFFYLLMDILVHWGVYQSLCKQIGAQGWILVTAIGLDSAVLAIFTFMKLQSDPLIVIFAVVATTAVFLFERFYLSCWVSEPDQSDHENH